MFAQSRRGRPHLLGTNVADFPHLSGRAVSGMVYLRKHGHFGVIVHTQALGGRLWLNNITFNMYGRLELLDQ